MRVIIRLGEPLRRAVGTYRLELDLSPEATLADMLITLQESYPDFALALSGKDLGHSHPYQLFKNHQHIPQHAWALTVLAEDDIIHIVIPVLGGSR
ncbi:MAG: MoaD/ThiS family protein [Chloroflexi bacterium]|nr:MoaD/ThiS family protein [Chloroflexota bacterium]